MRSSSVINRADGDKPRAKRWLIHLVWTARDRLARPRVLYPGDLSEHLLRDIGLTDACGGQRRGP